LKASYNWLKEFVQFDLSPEALADKLTMAGLEVEGIEETGDDVILNIAVTPNRPDCLSIKGLAREISVILDLPFIESITEIKEEDPQVPHIEIKDHNLCLRYASRIVTGVKIAPSPEWLIRRLEACGIRSTCNVVDVTNYVLLEMGQPLHAFDLDKLSGKRIVVKRAGEVKNFITLDQTERKLKEDILMIWDAERPVAIAGIMGGHNTEVSDSTVNVLLESAYFDPPSIRRASRYLNLSTESSYRFERGIDIEGVQSALDRAAQLISEIAGGKISRLTDVYPKKWSPKTFEINLDRIRALIGIDVDDEYMVNILHKLGFQIEKKGQNIRVTPPSFRMDVQGDVHIAEEIARIYGYEKIPSTLPEVDIGNVRENKTLQLIRLLRESLLRSGYSEAINYSFINPDILDTLNLSKNDRRRNLIYIRNPLRKEDRALRSTLIPSLLGNIQTNLNRGEEDLRFFEISRVFIASDRKLPDEILQVALICQRPKRTHLWAHDHPLLYDLKGTIENLLESIGIRDYIFTQERSLIEPYLHPGQAGAIMIRDKKIGSLGMVHPLIRESLELKGDICIAEIYDLEELMEFILDTRSFKPIPKFPYVERDLAVVVHKDTPVESVKREIISSGSDLIERIDLFDIYTGRPIPEDKKSLAFTIRFRAQDRTLTDEEVNELFLRIVENLKRSLKAELR